MTTNKLDIILEWFYNHAAGNNGIQLDREEAKQAIEAYIAERELEAVNNCVNIVGANPERAVVSLDTYYYKLKSQLKSNERVSNE